MMVKYSDDDSDSSDEEFIILDERDPRCKVIYTHPDFQAIFQSKKTSHKLIEYGNEDNERSSNKIKSDEDFYKINTSASENIICEKEASEDNAVGNNRFSAAKNFVQRVFKWRGLKKYIKKN